MATVKKAKAKVAAKSARAKKKVARKTAKVASLVVTCLAFAAVLSGCATSDAAQPAKSQTQNNEFRDCVFNIACRPLPDGSMDADRIAPSAEMFTQTQSLESTGSTDTFSQTATQTPTTDVKPDIDVKYNDAIAAATPASKAVLGSIGSGLDAVLDMMLGKKSGTVEVTKTDGTKATVQCENGQCSFCEDCTPQ